MKTVGDVLSSEQGVQRATIGRPMPSHGPTPPGGATGTSFPRPTTPPIQPLMSPSAERSVRTPVLQDPIGVPPPLTPAEQLRASIRQRLASEPHGPLVSRGGPARDLDSVDAVHGGWTTPPEMLPPPSGQSMPLTAQAIQDRLFQRVPVRK
jgi:hypothetical protein